MPDTRMYSSPLLSVSFFCPIISKLPLSKTLTTWTDTDPVNEFDCAVDPDPVKVFSPLLVNKSAPGIILSTTGGRVTEFALERLLQQGAQLFQRVLQSRLPLPDSQPLDVREYYR